MYSSTYIHMRMAACGRNNRHRHRLIHSKFPTYVSLIPQESRQDSRFNFTYTHTHGPPDGHGHGHGPRTTSALMYASLDSRVAGFRNSVPVPGFSSSSTTSEARTSTSSELKLELESVIAQCSGGRRQEADARRLEAGGRRQEIGVS